MIALGLNFGAYYFSRLINRGLVHHDLTGYLDKRIPLLPCMIVVYLGAYISWAVGFLLLCREKNEIRYEGFAALNIAEIVSMIIFIIFPTEMARPEIIGDGIFEKITMIIYNLDTPDNLFPSLHCLYNWFFFRISLKCDKVDKKYRICTFIIAILVFVSTVMVKQHLFMDIIGGIIVVEVGMLVANKFDLGRIYLALFSKLENNEE